MKVWILVIAFVFSASGTIASAGEGKGKARGHGAKQEEPSPEQRAKMAEHHEKMAACLKSEKTVKECHEEMHKACESAGGDCGMHGKGGKGKHSCDHDEGEG